MRDDRCPQYSVELPVLYETGSREGIVGHGYTLTIGNETVRFIGDKTLKVRSSICLTVPWPSQLPGGTCLNLRIFGRIKQAGPSVVEVQVNHYEFGKGDRVLSESRARHAAPERAAALEG
jgi:hypothetical protein